MKLGETEEAFLSIVILCLIISALFVSALVAIPVGLGGGIFYWFYRWNKRSQEPILLNLLKEQVEAVTPLSEVEVRNAVHDKLNHDIELDECIGEIYQWEQLAQPPKFPTSQTPIEVARYRDQAARYLNNYDHSDFVPALVEALRPLVTRGERGIFKATRTLKLTDVEYLAYRFEHPKYFRQLRNRLYANLERKPKEPFDYIRDTPLELIYERPTQVALKNRFEHTHCLGGTGSGKTSLIQYLISKDLEDDCTIIVIDNQRQMIPKLAALGYDTQLLSPQDPLAVNLFDMPNSLHTGRMMQYVLSGLLNAPLTPKQELVFQFGVTLMLANRGNIVDFQRLLNGETYDNSRLDDISRQFFETEFYTKGAAGYESTRKEINWRIWSLLKNPTLRDMFTATENRCHLDLSKKLILIDTDVHILGDYSGMFGRFFLAQLMLLAQERFVGSHRPVYVYIDEAYTYLDQSVTTMLETARKAKVGLFMAHQYMGQIQDPKVSQALMSLTSTKFAAQLSPSDAYAMAQAMRTTPEFINSQSKLHFALWQKGSETLSIETPVGVIEAMDQHPWPNTTPYCRTEPPPLPEEPEPEPEDPPEPEVFMVPEE